jgi:hypothetical protein
MQKSLAARIHQVLGVIVVVAAVWACRGTAEGAELVGELVSASGPVEVRPLGQAVWRIGSQRTVLQPGDMVRTGPGGAAEIAFTSGVVRMDENTVIVLPPPQLVPASAGNSSGLHLFLQGGRALFRVLKDRLQGTFEVITPSIIVGVKGTTFGVEQGPNLGVVVFEGIVAVSQTGRPDLPSIDVRGGQYTFLVQGRLTAPRAYDPGRPAPVWNGAPTTTTSNALPVRVGEGLTPGGPVEASPPVGRALTGANPAHDAEAVLPDAALGVPRGLGVSGPVVPGGGGAAVGPPGSVTPGGVSPPGLSPGGPSGLVKFGGTPPGQGRR